MKAVPLKIVDDDYVRCKPSDATHIEIEVPGPFPHRIIPVITHGTREGTDCWSWNGDTEKPTLKPSVKTWGGKANCTCHSWITDGKIQFLSDSTHDLAGTTCDLIDVTDWDTSWSADGLPTAEDCSAEGGK